MPVGQEGILLFVGTGVWALVGMLVLVTRIDGVAVDPVVGVGVELFDVEVASRRIGAEAQALSKIAIAAVKKFFKTSS